MINTTVQSETVDRLLEAIYEQYPEGASSMPNKLEESVINALYELDPTLSSPEEINLV